MPAVLRQEWLRILAESDSHLLGLPAPVYPLPSQPAAVIKPKAELPINPQGWGYQIIRNGAAPAAIDATRRGRSAA
jgi:hypothetical protein